MAKYDPLKSYLKRRKGAAVELTFAEIERILGNILPKSANLPAWWANERSPETRHVQCAAWLDAGYEARPATGRERVVFEPAPKARAPAD